MLRKLGSYPRGADVLRAAFSTWPAGGYVGTHRLFRCYLQERGRLAPPGPCQPRFALKEKHLQRLVELQGIAASTFSYDNWALTDFLSPKFLGHPVAFWPVIPLESTS